MFKFLHKILSGPPAPTYRIIPIMEGVNKLLNNRTLNKTEPLATYLSKGWYIYYYGDACVCVTNDHSLEDKLMKLKSRIKRRTL